MTESVTVPNQPPIVDPGGVRLACVGEAPSVEEISWVHCGQGHGFALEHWLHKQLVQWDRCPVCGNRDFTRKPTPMVGESGRFLNNLLRDAGLPRERVMVANCSRVPLHEDEKTLEHCRNGLARLAVDLEAFEPTCVLLLGNLALRAFHPAPEQSVTNWRGSLFEGTLAGRSYKCVAALHPAAVLREPSQLALLRVDVARAVEEAGHSGLATPLRVVDAPANTDAVCARLLEFRQRRRMLGYDIEGIVDTGITVCSFASTPNFALSIPFRRLDWSHVWNADDEARLMRAVGDVLEDAAVPKVAHNAAYEAFIHRWLHGHILRNAEDTMLAWHVLYPEQLKDLSVVASVLTRQPYWGSPNDWGVYGRPPTTADRDLYNAIDSCVTLECWQAIQREDGWTPAAQSYYAHQRALLEPCLEMMFEGLPYNASARDAMVAALQHEVYAFQGELDRLAGIAHPSFAEVRDAVALKLRWPKCATWEDLLTHAKPSYREAL